MKGTRISSACAAAFLLIVGYQRSIEAEGKEPVVRSTAPVNVAPVNSAAAAPVKVGPVNPAVAPVNVAAVDPSAVNVKDRNGVVLGRLVSVALGSVGEPSTVVVFTSTGYLAAVQVGPDNAKPFMLAFGQAGCTGGSYLGMDSSVHPVTAFIPNWVVYHSGSGKWVAGAGPISTPSAGPPSFHMDATGCVPGGGGPAMKYTPVRMLTSAEVGLPPTIHGPLRF